jgi:hypothetical protein
LIRYVEAKMTFFVCLTVLKACPHFPVHIIPTLQCPRLMLTKIDRLIIT